eukprot:CAMPEP_0117427774 /NCGR_PEP_ID=MMETSP0758-20121206/7580_1 /TAXON_ID=63605 /ORGANISM="Percolomonas cosmopolitus, Strain AE-1 (ATCC 50343)" /LENGTH=161 /DNA_ID=CAMNT_0005213663 /DNA_START=741 /DNA_END=1226 /DNA_ORIENTATION=-
MNRIRQDAIMMNHQEPEGLENHYKQLQAQMAYEKKIKFETMVNAHHNNEEEDDEEEEEEEIEFEDIVETAMKPFTENRSVEQRLANQLNVAIPSNKTAVENPDLESFTKALYDDVNRKKRRLEREKQKQLLEDEVDSELETESETESDHSSDDEEDLSDEK